MEHHAWSLEAVNSVRSAFLHKLGTGGEAWGWGFRTSRGSWPLPSLPSPAQEEPREGLAVENSEEGEKRGVPEGGGDGAVQALTTAIMRAPVVHQVPSAAVSLGCCDK